MKGETNCGNCRYFTGGSAVTGNGLGGCRRYPPQLIVLPMQTLQGVQASPAAAQPQVQPGQWCGEWKGADTSLLLNQ